MKKYLIKIVALSAICGLFTLTSCLDDLNTVPKDKDVTLADELFNDPATYALQK